MNKDKNRFPFRLTVQTILSAREELAEFEDRLALLSGLGFYGIELNLPDLQVLSPESLKSLLDKYGLVLTYVATGAYAKQRSLSLSTADDSLRAKAVDGALENAAYAQQMGAGIILGFFKGGPDADSPDPFAYLTASVRELCRRKPPAVPVLAEATNRRESCVLRRVSEGLALFDAVRDPSLYVLPDTYHMAREESDMAAAVTENLRRVRNIHISDDNRFFPGFGSIDFEAFLKTLLDCVYSGTLGIEGNIKDSFNADIQASYDFLRRLKLG